MDALSRFKGFLTYYDSLDHTFLNSLKTKNTRTLEAIRHMQVQIEHHENLLANELSISAFEQERKNLIHSLIQNAVVEENDQKPIGASHTEGIAANPDEQLKAYMDETEALHATLDKQRRAHIHEIEKFEIDLDNYKQMNVYLSSQEMSKAEAKKAPLEFPPDTKPAICRLAHDYLIQYNEYSEQHHKMYKQIDSTMKDAIEAAEYIQKQFNIKAHKLAIKAAVHLKANFGTTLDDLGIQNNGEVVPGNNSHTEASKLTWTRWGNAQVDGKTLKVYMTPFLEGSNSKKIVLIIKGEEGFAANTPMVPGGSVDLKHIAELQTDDRNIFHIALRNELKEETLEQFEMTHVAKTFSEKENTSDDGYKKHLFLFFRATVKETHKSPGTNNSEGYQEPKGAFILDIDHFMKKQELHVHSDEGDIAPALMNHALEHDNVKKLIGYDSEKSLDWESNGKLGLKDYLISSCTSELVENIRFLQMKMQQEAGSTQNWFKYLQSEEGSTEEDQSKLLQALRPETKSSIQQNQSSGLLQDSQSKLEKTPDSSTKKKKKKKK